MSAAPLADLVLLLHLAFILFVVFGVLLVWWRPRWSWLHLPMALWGAIVNLLGWTCPLTPLEKQLREAAGGPGYEGGFIEHYLQPLIYPQGQSDIELGVVLGVAALAWIGLWYGAVLWRTQRRRRARAA